jgi:hypothetical protein
MQHPLCTVLPDTPPSQREAERVTFVNALRSDWSHQHDAGDLHDAFQADGIPYTVQLTPPKPEPQWCGNDAHDDLLTPWQRNSALS